MFYAVERICLNDADDQASQYDRQSSREKQGSFLSVSILHILLLGAVKARAADSHPDPGG